MKERLKSLAFLTKSSCEQFRRRIFHTERTVGNAFVVYIML